jgi:hypothetical protein
MKFKRRNPNLVADAPHWEGWFRAGGRPLRQEVAPAWPRPSLAPRVRHRLALRREGAPAWPRHGLAPRACRRLAPRGEM